VCGGETAPAGATELCRHHKRNLGLSQLDVRENSSVVQGVWQAFVYRTFSLLSVWILLLSILYLSGNRKYLGLCVFAHGCGSSVVGEQEYWAGQRVKASSITAVGHCINCIKGWCWFFKVKV